MRNTGFLGGVLAFAVIFVGISLAPATEAAQAPSQQQGGQGPLQQQSPPQGNSSVAPSPKPAQTNGTSQEPQSKEQQNLQHEQQTGTSKDRIFWVVPNFLSLQDSTDIPVLSSGEKFKVVGRSMIDPFEFVLVGLAAGIGQAANSTPSYGQGMSGYGLRYGSGYGDNIVENFMASAVLPSLLHQDPRYYELGHGGFWRRSGHALSRLVITRSDSGKTQFNYSEVFGAGMAAAISTYSYHPQSEREFSNVVTVWGTQMGYDLGTYMLKEFWPDLRRRHRRKAHPDSP